MNATPPISRNTTLQIGLTVLLVLALAGLWLPPTWLWGLNHAAWLPWPVRFGVPFGALLVLWSPLSQKFGDWLSHVLDGAVLNHKLIAYGLVPTLGSAVFWLIREPTHMLGDGQTLATLMATDRLYHGFDFMTYHLVAQIYQALGGGGEAAAFRVFSGLSCLSGALYLGAAAWSARRLADPGATRILLYSLLIFGTPVQLFLGYAEVYAPLSIALLVFLTFFILYYQNRCGLLAVTVAWSAGLFCHLNALFLAPLLVLALIRPPENDQTPWWRRLLVMIWPALMALGLAAIFLMASGYDRARFAMDFGHATTGAGILVPLTGPDGLLTWRHLKDLLNLILLLAPVPAVLLLARGRFKPETTMAKTLRILLMVGITWLVLLLAMVHLKLGAVRDWDLFAPHMSLVVLGSWYAATAGRKQCALSPGDTGRLVIIAIALLVPWLTVNANSHSALARLEAATADDAPYPRGLLQEQIAYHHQLTGNKSETTKHYRRAGEVCPANPRFHAIYGTHVLNMGNTGEALAAYHRALAVDSTYVYGLKMAVTVQVIRDDYTDVLPMARRLKRLQRQDDAVAEAHGTAAQRLGLWPEAIAAYQRVLSREPRRLDLMERVARLYSQQLDFAAAEPVFRRLLATTPDRTDYALGLASTIWQDYLARPAAYSPTENRIRLAEVASLIGRLVAVGRQQNEDVVALADWQELVRIQMDGLTE